jgi:hypothetical protein
MNNIIENLDRYYDSFIDQENNWTFFVGLADYVKYILEIPKIKSVFDRPKEDKDKELIVLDKAEQEAIKELLEIKVKILDYIKKKKINNKKEIKNLLLKLADLETGKINPNYYKSSRLKEGLEDLLKYIAENGHREWVKDNFPISIREKFVVSKADNNKVVQEFEYEFEPSKLSARYATNSSIRNRKDTELWGVCEHLTEVYKAFNHNLDEELSKDVKNLKEQIDAMRAGKNRLTEGYPYLFDSMTYNKEKREAEEKQKKEKDNENRENFKLYAIRMHNYLTKELNAKEPEEPKKNIGDKHINKITIVLLNSGKYLYAINDDYRNTKKILDSSEWWEILIQEIKDRGLPPERRTNTKPIPKEMADYFNYNNDKCPIYFKGKYKLTNIFVGRDIDIAISPEIKTEFISEKKYLKRKK